MLDRIARAAPPASSFEGQLQRWRDSRGRDDQEATETAPGVVDVGESDASAGDDEIELQDDPPPSHPPRRGPGRPRKYDARHRVLCEHRDKDARARSEGSWWTRPAVQGSREAFRAAAGDRADRLRTDPAAAKVKTKLNFLE